MNQLSIFDMGIGFCFDPDINEIVDGLDDLCRKYNIEHDKPNFRIWQHVPSYGYRLTYNIYVHEEVIEAVQPDLYAIVESAKKKDIELQPCPGFKGQKEKQPVYIYSTYKDKRRRIKNV